MSLQRTSSVENALFGDLDFGTEDLDKGEIAEFAKSLLPTTQYSVPVQNQPGLLPPANPNTNVANQMKGLPLQMQPQQPTGGQMQAPRTNAPPPVKQTTPSTSSSITINHPQIRNHFVTNIERLSGGKVPAEKANEFKGLLTEYKENKIPNPEELIKKFLNSGLKDIAYVTMQVWNTLKEKVTQAQQGIPTSLTIPAPSKPAQPPAQPPNPVANQAQQLGNLKKSVTPVNPTGQPTNPVNPPGSIQQPVGTMANQPPRMMPGPGVMQAPNPMGVSGLVPTGVPNQPGVNLVGNQKINPALLSKGVGQPGLPVKQVDMKGMPVNAMNPNVQRPGVPQMNPNQPRPPMPGGVQPTMGPPIKKAQPTTATPAPTPKANDELDDVKGKVLTKADELAGIDSKSEKLLPDEDDSGPIPFDKDEPIVNMDVLRKRIATAVNTFTESKKLKPNLQISDDVYEFMSYALEEYIRTVVEELTRVVDQRCDVHKSDFPAKLTSDTKKQLKAIELREKEEERKRKREDGDTSVPMEEQKTQPMNMNPNPQQPTDPKAKARQEINLLQMIISPKDVVLLQQLATKEKQRTLTPQETIEYNNLKNHIRQLQMNMLKQRQQQALTTPAPTPTGRRVTKEDVTSIPHIIPPHVVAKREVKNRRRMLQQHALQNRPAMPMGTQVLPANPAPRTTPMQM